MELNRVQNAELEVSKLNSSFFLELLSNLSTQYPTTQRYAYKNFMRRLAKKRDPNNFTILYLNLLDHQRHTISRYLELSHIVKHNTEELLKQLRSKHNL